MTPIEGKTPLGKGRFTLKTVFSRWTWGAFLMVVGYLLSPLSWWNDAFINLPLAVGFGWLVSLFYPPAFGVSVVVGYWLTNVIGFILMHKGGQQMLGKEKSPKREILKDLLISVLYTALILALLHFKVLQPFQNYHFR